MLSAPIDSQMHREYSGIGRSFRKRDRYFHGKKTEDNSFIFVTTILLFGTACEPPLPLEVENQTNQIITVYVQGDPYFVYLQTVQPRVKLP